MIFRVDDFLVDRVAQPIADRLAARGMDADAVGRSCMIGAGVFMLCETMARHQSGSLSAFGAAMVGLVIPGLFVFLWMTPRPTMGQTPVVRLTAQVWRALFVWFALPLEVAFAVAGLVLPGFPYGAWDIFRLCYSLCATSGLFLMSCRPRPPSRQREEAVAPGLGPIRATGQ